MLFNAINILVIEDNPGDFVLIEAYLEETRIDTQLVAHVTTLKDGIREIVHSHYDLVLLDLSLPDSYAADSYSHIQKCNEDVPVIILSGSKDEDLALEIVRQGAQDYLIKDELSSRILEKTILYSIERKRNLASIHQSQLQYQLLFDNNPIPMWTYDVSTLRFLKVNHAATVHYGYTREEFLSMTILDIRSDGDKGLLTVFNDFKQDQPYRNAGEWRHIKKTGDTIIVEIVSHIVSHEPNIIKLVVAHDVTEKIKSKAELEKSERIFRSVAESFPNGFISLLDENFNVLYTNGLEYQKLGVDATSFFGKKLFSDVTNAIQSKEIAQQLKKSLQGETVTFDVIMAPNAYSCIAAPIALEEGYAEKIIVITHNVTKRNRMEQQSRLLESVVLNSPNGVIIVNNPVKKSTPLEIIFANQAQQDMTGYSLAEMMGKSPKMFQGPGTDKTILSKIRTAINTHSPIEADLINYKKDGSLYWLHLSVVPVFNGKGTCTHLIGLSKDITERKIAEQEIQEANVNLREKNKQLYEIAQINSHVIRKPVASILGLISLLDKNKLADTEEYQIVNNLEICVKELDSVIHTIAQKALIQDKSFTSNLNVKDTATPN